MSQAVPWRLLRLTRRAIKGHALFSDLSIFSDAPIENVNGISMAIRHSHFGESRVIDVDFLYNDRLYSLSLHYPISQDALFADYADKFYRSIEMY